MEKNKSIEKLLLGKKVSVISYDSGGAEVLSSFTKHYKAKYSFTVGGPAQKIFENKINNFKNLPLTKNIDKSDIVITGTGLDSDLEYEAIKYCKKNNKKVFSYIDHWVNYKKRFIRRNKLLLPNELWVGDNDAKKIAKKNFKKIKIVLVPNPYWIQSINNFKKIKKIVSNTILFVSSNNDRSNNKRINDQVIFTKFLKYLKNKDIKKINIRRHPSEKNNKFKLKFYKKKFIKFDNNKNLLSSLSSCSKIFGHNSMALVLGKLCGLDTFHININGKLSIPKKFIDHII